MNIGSFDAAAAIFDTASVTSAAGVLDTKDKTDTTLITLTKSYRSTKEIAEFCNALLLSPNFGAAKGEQ